MSDCHYPVIILGAGAAGMMCAAYSGPGTLVVDHARAPGEKIRISGGGRCNFTNLEAGPAAFLSDNPHFAKSALKRYSQWDFISLVGEYQIAWHEKTLGQLFCDGSSKQVIAMLRAEMDKAGARLQLETSVTGVRKVDARFVLTLDGAMTGEVSCDRLVLATGGLSIPKMGATGFAYGLARQFGLDLVPTRAGLVPFVFDEQVLAGFKPLAGVACEVEARCNEAAFAEAMLFTHRGLSGPAILQVSSFWREGDPVSVHLLPGTDLFGALRDARAAAGKRDIATVLADLFPKRLGQFLAADAGVTGNIADFSDKRLRALCDRLEDWQLVPSGTEGYRTAEVTVGGVSTAGLSSQTMEARAVPGLYFIGECVDVTGWLGGYNFQWAWSSGWACGTAIAKARLIETGADERG